MAPKKQSSTIFILGLLTALGPFSIDMYLPGFRDIADNLHTSVATVALSLSSYFIGISAGQLLYGPLLDRHGRKKPLYAGLVLYILSSASCLVVKDINVLIVLRFIQAVGSCAAAVGSMAMVRDLFGAKDSARVFSLLLLVVGASPMIAPTAGGYVITLFGWRAVFVILTIMGILILLLTIFALPESYQPDPNFSLKPRPIINNFLSVLQNRQFLVYALTGSLAFAGLFAYVSGSPMVFMDIYHVDKKTYGWIFAFLSVAFIGLSQFNTLLLKKYSSERIAKVAITGQVLVSAVFLGGSLAGWAVPGWGLFHNVAPSLHSANVGPSAGAAPLALPLIIFFIFLFLACLGFVNPNAAALSLAPFAKNAGSASALMGALQMGIGALASIGVSVFSNGTATPMIAIMGVTTAVGALILYLFHPQ